MLLTAASPAAVPQAAPPEWVAEWLNKREEDKTKREEKAKTVQVEAASDDPARAEKRLAQANKSAAKRVGLVAKGLEALDLWLDDLMRGGLAGVELKPASFWENQAARMVDAQASGIATRLRALAGIPNSGPDWPDRLLTGLGRIALLMHAYQRIDALDAPLAGRCALDDRLVAQRRRGRRTWRGRDRRVDRARRACGDRRASTGQPRPGCWDEPHAAPRWCCNSRRWVPPSMKPSSSAHASKRP